MIAGLVAATSSGVDIAELPLAEHRKRTAASSDVSFFILILSLITENPSKSIIRAVPLSSARIGDDDSWQAVFITSGKGAFAGNGVDAFRPVNVFGIVSVLIPGIESRTGQRGRCAEERD